MKGEGNKSVARLHIVVNGRANVGQPLVQTISTYHTYRYIPQPLSPGTHLLPFPLSHIPHSSINCCSSSLAPMGAIACEGAEGKASCPYPAPATGACGHCWAGADWGW